MKLTLNHMYTSASGKACKKEDTYAVTNQQTGKVYAAKYHPHKATNTAELKAVKAKFSDKASAAATWWAANKEIKKKGVVTQEGSEDYKKLMALYKQQIEFGTPYVFLRSLVQDDMTIKLGKTFVESGYTPEGGTTSGGTTGGNTNPPSLS